MSNLFFNTKLKFTQQNQLKLQSKSIFTFSIHLIYIDIIFSSKKIIFFDPLIKIIYKNYVLYHGHTCSDACCDGLGILKLYCSNY